MSCSVHSFWKYTVFDFTPSILHDTIFNPSDRGADKLRLVPEDRVSSQESLKKTLC